MSFADALPTSNVADFSVKMQRHTCSILQVKGVPVSAHRQRQSHQRLCYRICGLLCFSLLITGLSAADPPATPATAQNAKDGAEMVLVPRGRFLMGSTPADVGLQFDRTGLPEDWQNYTDDEAPRHARTIDAF